MFSVLRAKHSRENEAAEGFGVLFDNDEFIKQQVISTDGAVANLAVKRGYTAYKYSGINGGDTQRVLFKPLLGILNQPKFLPIRYMPLTIELELVNDITEPIFSNFTNTFGSDINCCEYIIIMEN